MYKQKTCTHSNNIIITPSIEKYPSIHNATKIVWMGRGGRIESSVRRHASIMFSRARLTSRTSHRSPQSRFYQEAVSFTFPVLSKSCARVPRCCRSWFIFFVCVCVQCPASFCSLQMMQSRTLILLCCVGILAIATTTVNASGLCELYALGFGKRCARRLFVHCSTPFVCLFDGLQICEATLFAGRE